MYLAKELLSGFQPGDYILCQSTTLLIQVVGLEQFWLDGLLVLLFLSQSSLVSAEFTLHERQHVFRPHRSVSAIPHWAFQFIYFGGLTFNLAFEVIYNCTCSLQLFIKWCLSAQEHFALKITGRTQFTQACIG